MQSCAKYHIIVNMQKLVSVIIPIFNEQETLAELHQKLVDVFAKINMPFELIFVDDGSHDKTPEILKKLMPAKVLTLRRNYGQTIALETGIRKAKGELIITMDSDLENDPYDILPLLKKLDDGFDVVTGWRKNRWKGYFFTRRFPSYLANLLLSKVSGVKLHDFGCMMRVHKKEILKNLSFSGDMHRLILAYIAQRGGRIAEIPVKFKPRQYGKSHYGLGRTFGVLADIFAFYFFEKYHNKPIHFFGLMSVIFLILSTIVFIFMVLLRVLKIATFIETPLPTLAVFLAAIGFQFILLGLVAELIYRFSRQEKVPSSDDYIQEEISNT